MHHLSKVWSQLLPLSTSMERGWDWLRGRGRTTSRKQMRTSSMAIGSLIKISIRQLPLEAYRKSNRSSNHSRKNTAELHPTCMLSILPTQVLSELIILTRHLTRWRSLRKLGTKTRTCRMSGALFRDKQRDEGSSMGRSRQALTFSEVDQRSQKLYYRAKSPPCPNSSSKPC